jgi:hypothetical protein
MVEFGGNSPSVKPDMMRKTSPGKFSIHVAMPGSTAYF